MSDNEHIIPQIIASAEEFMEPASNESLKPRLFVDRANPDTTINEVIRIMAERSDLYDRGVPVRLAYDATQKGYVAHVMTPDGVIRAIHQACRPYRINRGEEVDCQFPKALAIMYLDARGEWQLKALAGIASSPLLHEDGSIGATKGYDPQSGMWVEDVPDLAGLVPNCPTRAEAEAALYRIRDTFKTFCFADAETCVPYDPYSFPVVDISEPPGKDESAFLVALLTAVCRPSLPLAPGLLMRAAPMSGAGAGKGLLARCISIIAFGREPHAVTGGASNEEIEKRIASELMEGNPVLFLDNLNNTAFKSDLLASAITERPAKVRILGKSQMVLLNASAFVILTGNGLTTSEDLARRFITIELDARMENPEARDFPVDIKTEVRNRRRDMLADLLTIFRWGRQSDDLPKGKPLGSFEQWASWVRDPLLALGCQDPAERVSEAKERDSRRQQVREVFEFWSKHHGERPIAARDLHEDVKNVIDPQGRGRQFLTAQLEKLSGARLGGRHLTRQAPPGKWGKVTYALVSSGEGQTHRGHRGHRVEPGNQNGAGPPEGAPMPPMPPVPLNPSEEIASPEAKKWSARI